MLFERPKFPKKLILLFPLLKYFNFQFRIFLFGTTFFHKKNAKQKKVSTEQLRKEHATIEQES